MPSTASSTFWFTRPRLMMRGSVLSLGSSLGSAVRPEGDEEITPAAGVETSGRVASAERSPDGEEPAGGVEPAIPVESSLSGGAGRDPVTREPEGRVRRGRDGTGAGASARSGTSGGVE